MVNRIDFQEKSPKSISSILAVFFTVSELTLMKSFALVAFAFFLLLASFSAYSQQTDFFKLDKEINLSITQEDWIQVLELAKNQIRMDVDRGEGYYYSALALVNLGEIKMAKPYLEQVKKMDQEDLYIKVFELEKKIGSLSGKTLKQKNEYDNLAPGFIPLRKIDRFFYSYIYDPITPLGFSFGSINHRGIGTYMAIRSNSAIFTKAGELTVNNNGNVSGTNENQDAEITGNSHKGIFEGIMGITWKIKKPLWMYTGAGLNHSRQFWEVEIVEENQAIKVTEWAKKPSANLNQATIESGIILDFKGLNLRSGVSVVGFDFSEIRYQIGVGFSVKSK